MEKILQSSKEKNILSSNQVLILDKIGIIGGALCRKIDKSFLVVFASRKKQQFIKDFSNITYVPYEKRIPLVPDGTYSHIIIVDGNKTTSGEILEPFISKAKRDGSVFAFVTYLKNTDRQLTTNVASFYKKAKVIIYGDVFDNVVIPSVQGFASIANDLIYQAATKGKIEISGDGLLKTYPVSMDDLVMKIVDKVFSSSLASQVFNIFPKHYQTQISLAHMIQKPNPAISIDFVPSSKEENDEYLEFLSGGEYLLEDKYSLASRIREVNLVYEIDPEEQEIKPSYVSKRKKLRSFLFRFLFFLIIFLLLPLITTMSFFILGAKSIKETKTAIDKGNLPLAVNLANNSKVFFNLSKKSGAVLLFESKFFGLDKKTKSLIRSIRLGETMSLSIFDLLSATKDLISVFNGVSQNPREDFFKATNLIKNAIVLFRQRDAEGEMPLTMESQLKNFDTLIKLVSNTVDIWPDILGFNGKKTYLVLFQNNMELRPGGGFIGSYGILTIDSGRVLDFSIHDVYDADGQLKGHVEPPYPLRRFLPTAHLYLRDSNFDLDFTKSAFASAFLFSKETGSVADGVIGIDLSFVKDLVGALGDIYVDDYRETVNKDNLFLLSESHVEKNFFPGSSQKKDFLRSLFMALKMGLENKKVVSYFTLAKAINNSINEKHLLFAFGDSTVQDIFTVNNWSGALWDEREISQSKINDFVGINEANLGINKANFFIKRKISPKISISEDGTIKEQLSIAYFNASDKWPGGDYKNYLRIVVPKSFLTDVLIDGEKQNIISAVTDPLVYEKKNFLPPRGLEVETTGEAGKTVYGLLVSVPSGKLKTIIIKYNLFQKITLDKSFSYSLKLFKQPGTEEYPLEMSLTFPSSYSIVFPLTGISKKENEISLYKSLLSDEEFFINFAAK